MLGSPRVPPEKVSEEMGMAREKSAVEGRDTHTPVSSTENRASSKCKERAGGNRQGGSLGKDRRVPGGRQRRWQRLRAPRHLEVLRTEVTRLPLPRPWTDLWVDRPNPGAEPPTELL